LRTDRYAPGLSQSVLFSTKYRFVPVYSIFALIYNRFKHNLVYTNRC